MKTRTPDMDTRSKADRDRVISYMDYFRAHILETI